MEINLPLTSHNSKFAPSRAESLPGRNTPIALSPLVLQGLQRRAGVGWGEAELCAAAVRGKAVVGRAMGGRVGAATSVEHTRIPGSVRMSAWVSRGTRSTTFENKENMDNSRNSFCYPFIDDVSTRTSNF